MDKKENAGFQPDTPILPGLKVVGRIDLPKSKQKPDEGRTTSPSSDKGRTTLLLSSAKPPKKGKAGGPRFSINNTRGLHQTIREVIDENLGLVVCLKKKKEVRFIK